MTDKARVRLYMGTTGSGKTFKFCEHLREEKRVFVFDTMADEKLEHYGALVQSTADAIALASTPTATGEFRIRMQFDNVEQFDKICEASEYLQNCMIYVDELALFVNSAWMPPHFRRLIRLGRHWGPQGVGLAATTQRPPDIQALIRSQAKEIYIFQSHEPNDLSYIGKFLPDVDRVKSIQIGEYILWTPQASRQPSNLPTTNAPPSEPREPTSQEPPIEDSAR